MSFVIEPLINKVSSTDMTLKETNKDIVDLIEYYWINETPISDGKDGRSFPIILGHSSLFSVKEKENLKTLWDKKNTKVYDKKI
jgi:hypothetical protein